MARRNKEKKEKNPVPTGRIKPMPPRIYFEDLLGEKYKIPDKRYSIIHKFYSEFVDKTTDIKKPFELRGCKISGVHGYINYKKCGFDITYCPEEENKDWGIEDLKQVIKFAYIKAKKLSTDQVKFCIHVPILGKTFTLDKAMILMIERRPDEEDNKFKMFMIQYIPQ